MIIRKKYLSILLVLVLSLSSIMSTAAEESNNNLYPNPEADIKSITDTALKYPDQTTYSFHDLVVGGSSVNGNVLIKTDNAKGITRVYTLPVAKEGMVSINLVTSGILDKSAKLDVAVYMKDPRNNTVTVNNDVQTTLSDKPEHPYVEKNYVYYAYPGTYYFVVTGSDRSGTTWTMLNYAISATQDVYVEEAPTNMANPASADYPNFLGTTSLANSLTLKSTKSMKNWREPTSSGGISGVYTNSYDKFTFVASKNGTVNVRLINHKTTILDTYLAAYHSSSGSTAFKPTLKLYVTQPNVTSPLRTECLYGQEIITTFTAKAGETYYVELSGGSHPMAYSLDFSYGHFGDSNQTTSGSTSTASSWAVSEINQSIGVGLQTPKMMNNDFKSYATREEFAELVMQLYDQLGGTSVSSSQNPFGDTTNSEIIRAKNAGIINGTSTTTFGPNENLTREQLCVMILRTLDATKTNYNMNLAFQKNYSDQALISSWAMTSVRTLNSYKIINGSGDILDPKSTVTKEVAILMMYRAYNLFK